MNAEKLRVLVVDDEPLARNHLTKLLAREPDVEVAGVCRNAREAMQTAGETQPDLAFVDVAMPGRSGVELADDLRARGVVVVFVTAFAEHAPAAFELEAADYILKPFDEQRLRRALERARKRVDSFARLQGAPEARTTPHPPLPIARLAVDAGGRTRLIEVQQIDWIAADGKRVLLHLGRETLPHRDTLRALEERLERGAFARIHRGAIVRVAAIRELWPAFHGDWTIVLHSGQQLVLSRRYRRSFRDAAGL